MPYFIYRITPPRKLDLLDEKTDYKEARQLVRAQRAEIAEGENHTVRMIFAKSPQEAEKLLSVPREERVIGED